MPRFAWVHQTTMDIVSDRVVFIDPAAVVVCTEGEKDRASARGFKSGTV